MRGRRRVGHGHARAATVLVVAFGLVAGVLSVAATPAIVQAADPPPGPVPPGDCEWFGEATYDRTQVYDRTASKAKQTDVWHMDARSTPVTGTECGAEVNATYDMTFADEDTVTCDPPDADPYSTTITYRQRIEVAGSQDTASVTQLVADGAEGDTRINLTFPVDPFLGTRTYSIDGGCRATDPTVVDCTTDASAAGNGYCVFDPAIVFGPCQSSRTASAVPFYFPPGAQAIQGACTLGFEDVQSTATLTVSDVRTWRLRRTVCDRSVDTDGGGIGDCDEFDNRTNPLDPDDDAATDDDRDDDGFPDASDNCPDTWQADQANLDGDRHGDVCEPLDAVDDDLGDDIVAEYDNGVAIDVLANDIGDGLEIWNVVPLGHDEDSFGWTDTINWNLAGVTPGTYQLLYTVRDDYGRFDTAVVTVRVSCNSNERASLDMHWDAKVDGPAFFDVGLYGLDADATYCEADGAITEFTLTPSVDTETNAVLNQLGFDLRTSDVSYSPPRSTYPQMTVAADTTFYLCANPLQLLRAFVGRSVEVVVGNAVDWLLGRNLRRSGEWTAADLRTALEAARDRMLREVRWAIKQVPFLGPQAGDALYEHVADTLRYTLNQAISSTVDAVGPEGWVGGAPDNVVQEITTYFIKQLTDAAWICDGLEVWQPSVTLVGRPLLGPLQPVPQDLYKNPFVTVVGT